MFTSILCRVFTDYTIANTDLPSIFTFSQYEDYLEITGDLSDCSVALKSAL